jgi:hypothetical protein
MQPSRPFLVSKLSPDTWAVLLAIALGLLVKAGLLKAVTW